MSATKFIMSRPQQPEMVGEGLGKEHKRASGGGVWLRNPQSSELRDRGSADSSDWALTPASYAHPRSDPQDGYATFLAPCGCLRDGCVVMSGRAGFLLHVDSRRVVAHSSGWCSPSLWVRDCTAQPPCSASHATATRPSPPVSDLRCVVPHVLRSNRH